MRMLMNAKRIPAKIMVAALTVKAATHANVNLGTVDTTARQTLMTAHLVSFSVTVSADVLFHGNCFCTQCKA